jgi:hypothetical protein
MPSIIVVFMAEVCDLAKELYHDNAIHAWGIHNRRRQPACLGLLSYYTRWFFRSHPILRRDIFDWNAVTGLPREAMK